MMKGRVLFAAMCLVIVMALPARAVDGSTALATIFNRTCLKYPDSPARLKVWLDTYMKPAEEKNEGFFLGKRAGKAWIYREGDVNFAVLVLDDGRCAVNADSAELEPAMAVFESQARADGFKVSQNSDEPLKGDFHGVAGHVRMYDLYRGGKAYTVRASGTSNPRAIIDAELMLVPHSE
jgi:hypothetical protein